MEAHEASDPARFTNWLSSTIDKLNRRDSHESEWSDAWDVAHYHAVALGLPDATVALGSRISPDLFSPDQRGVWRDELRKRLVAAYQTLNGASPASLPEVRSVADFITWIDSILDRLNSAAAESSHSLYWSSCWDEAQGHCYSLGRLDGLEALGQPLPAFACGGDGVNRSIRESLRARFVALRAALTGRGASSLPREDSEDWKPVTQEGFTILRFLNAKFPTVQGIAEIAAKAELDTRTAKKHIAALMNEKYCESIERTGFVITPLES